VWGLVVKLEHRQGEVLFFAGGNVLISDTNQGTHTPVLQTNMEPGELTVSPYTDQATRWAIEESMFDSQQK
jgi:hypothetical protein